MPHPDLAAEQAHLDRARACLARMHARTSGVLAGTGADASGLAANAADAAVAQAHLEHRLASIDDQATSLCFGRIDTTGGEVWHVGRRHVEDDDATPVVVDWRAPVSTAFYRATRADPQGLDRRRRFSLDGPALVDVLEEDFTDPDGAALSGGVPDPLLAELDRARGPEMRDIVATIAAEQDEIIRAPLDACLVVQGGPGTGKTAVALHRAAFLLYEHRARLDQHRVLVLGPNPVFLRYVQGVLPSLGETAVVQTTLTGLVGARWPVVRDEDPAVARLKGDPRAAELLARAVRDRIAPPADEVVLATPWGRVRLAPAVVAGAVAEVLARGVHHGVGRDALRALLVHRAYEVHERTSPTPALKDRFAAGLRADRSFGRLVDRTWPTMAAPAALGRAFGRRLRALADGLFDGDEVDALAGSVRPADGWTAADVALLDEADALLAGPRAGYGHVVVDEAQDLSALALRMAARRARAGSMTLVGDLAQGTEAWSQPSWEAAVAAFEPPAPVLRAELTVGYRVPGPVLDLANRLLAEAAPGVRPSRSVRGGAPPVDREVPAGEVVPVAATTAAELAGRHRSVAVIAGVARHGDLAAALDRTGVTWADAARAGLGAPVALLDPVGAKGLEFDAVVVVDPAEVSAGPRGANALYVALTRAVQELTILRVRWRG